MLCDPLEQISSILLEIIPRTVPQSGVYHAWFRLVKSEFLMMGAVQNVLNQ
jgi:hypothetical protein